MVFDEIFRGNFSMEDLSYPSDPEYKNLSGQIAEQADNLKSILGEDKTALLDDMLNQMYSLQLMEAEACFKAGFAIGMEVQRECVQQLKIFHNDNA